jgi:hypothetical protein
VERGCIRFQEAVAMAVYYLNGVAIGDGDVVWLDSDDFAVFLVGSVDGEVAFPAATLVHQPEVGEGRWEGRWDLPDCICAEVGEEVVENWSKEEDPGREEGRYEHGCGSDGSN